MSNSFDIKKLGIYKEGNRLEFKKASIGLPDSIWATYSSFANSYGGVIILGVEESKDGQLKVSGIYDKEHVIKDFWNILNNKNKVSINLLTERNITIESVDGEDIIIITVPRAKREQKPVYINDDIFGGTYRRDGDGDYHCGRSEVLAMLRDEPETTLDMKVLEGMTLSVFDPDTVNSYRNRYSAYRPGHVWESISTEQFLEMIGACSLAEDGIYRPTAAGLLMFGYEYKIVREFPEYFLDYREVLDPTIRWTDRVQSTSGDWSGNLFDFFFRVYNKLVKDLKIPFKLEGITRIEDTPVHKAIREAFVNCLVNTDYYVPRGIVIKKNANEIILENPGYIRVGKHQMLKGGISDPRNKALMKMFNMIGIGERAGSGVPDIFSVWEKEGWDAPRIEELFNVDRTVLILPFTKKSSDKTAGNKTGGNDMVRLKDKTIDNMNKVVLFLNENGGSASPSNIANKLNLGVSQTRELLRKMVEGGILEASGISRNRLYSLKDKSKSVRT